MRFVFLLTVFSWPLLAFSQSNQLFQALTTSIRTSQEPHHSSEYIASTTYGLVNHAVTSSDFDLTLGSKTYAAIITKITDWQNSVSQPLRTIQGSLYLEGNAQGSFTITKTTEHAAPVLMSHFLLTDGRTFRLASGSSLAVLSEISIDKLPDCDHPPHPPQPIQRPSSRNDNLVNQDFTTIDVMLVYSPDARLAAGGVAQIESEVANAIALANTAYSESGIGVQLQLVKTYELDSPESGSMSQDLVSLTEADDSKWDEIHKLRDESGADLVAALLNNNTSCGLGWVMTAPSAYPDYGFSVIARDCIGNHSLAHELGHNMGAQHDVDNSAAQGAYTYSYGWRFSGDTEGPLRTIMAYAPGFRINRFSNPNLMYDGQALGIIGQADNASTLERTKGIVASYRSAPTPTPEWTSTPTMTGTTSPTPTATPLATLPTPVPTPNPFSENTASPEPTATHPIPSPTPNSLPEIDRIARLTVDRRISRQGQVIFVVRALDTREQPVAMVPVVLSEAFLGDIETRFTNRRGTARVKVHAKGAYYFTAGDIRSRGYTVKRYRKRSRRNRRFFGDKKLASDANRALSILR